MNRQCILDEESLSDDKLAVPLSGDPASVPGGTSRSTRNLTNFVRGLGVTNAKDYFFITDALTLDVLRLLSRIHPKSLSIHPKFIAFWLAGGDTSDCLRRPTWRNVLVV